MFVLVGLGNPGSEYETTRHNAGFLLLDSLADEAKISVSQSKFKALFGKGRLFNQDVLLVKPQTYMNLSGHSVQQFLSYFKIPESHLIVLFDDLDLEPGIVKMRLGGGHGGHNGIRSILECLSSDKFYRIKLGIGRPAHKNATSNWVLNPFTKHELSVLQNDMFAVAKDRIQAIFKEVKP